MSCFICGPPRVVSGKKAVYHRGSFTECEVKFTRKERKIGTYPYVGIKGHAVHDYAIKGYIPTWSLRLSLLVQQKKTER